MDTTRLERLKQWFSQYVAGFYTDGKDEFLDSHIRLKEDHTARVCAEMQFLTDELDLAADRADLAQAAALLHDVGRFEQMRKYRTYVDPKSVDHSLLGAEILDQQKVLDDLDPQEREILRSAVRWHGAKTIPTDLEPQAAEVCKLIRDADKLDVLGLLIGYFKRYYDNPIDFPLEVEFPDDPRVSDHIIRAVCNHEMVDYARIETLHDAQLVLLGWVFDINFTPALKRIAEKQYLEQIAAFLPQTSPVRQAVDHIFQYLRRQIKK